MRAQVSRFAVSATLVIGSVAALGLTQAPASQAAGPAPLQIRNGGTSELAAASCWEIKQKVTGATDGVYWLQTPALGAPQQFYCDMTTDGGGWVLVGRGREDWNWRHNGEGSPADVRDRTTGADAFRPAYVSAPTVDGLLNGGRVDALSEGVRLRRATNVTGTTWQEVRFRYAKRDRWSWQMEAVHDLAGFSFDSATGSGSTTRDFKVQNDARRVFTYPWANHNYLMGFSFGGSVAGQNNSTSYLWQNSTEGSAIPFTQVFIRPRLTSADLSFQALPDAGLPAKPVQSRVSTRTSPDTEWGVTGLVNDPQRSPQDGSNELVTEVQALRQVGDTMYVGGHFRYVQHGPTGTPVEQSFLAAFDVNTGEWRDNFRPALDGAVWDIRELPNGQVAVAGQFKSVNGNPAYAGLVSLDPATGQVSSDWGLRIENRSTVASRFLEVRALDVQDGFLYFGGDFTHTVDFKNLTTAGQQVTQSVNRLGRIWVGPRNEVDWRWRPNMGGSVIDLDVSSRGDNVYIAGYFLQVNGATMRNAGILSTAIGAPTVPGQQPFVPSRAASKTYQQAIQEVGDRVWVGGSEHNLWMNDRNTFQLLRGNIALAGGDIQAITESNGIIYAGGHFRNNMYQGSTTYSEPRPFAQADGVNWLGAWDAKTGDFLPDFVPALESPRKRGPWALATDSNGCVWAGADFTTGGYHDGGQQWLGGFGKLCPRDTAPPPTPENLRVGDPDNNQVLVSWDAAEANATYEVYLGDRIVATTRDTSVRLTAPLSTGRYFVRALDAEGNASATTSVVTVQASTVLMPASAAWAWHYGDLAKEQNPEYAALPATAAWRWHYDAAALPENWNSAAFDDSGWSSGTGEFGYGDGDETTVIPAGSTPRTMSAQFRTTFDVPDPSKAAHVIMTMVRDDGAVVYLNGEEVARSNMPSSGAITQTTPATVGYSTRADETAKQVIELDKSKLIAGTNTLAVSVHQSDAWSGDLSFSAAITIKEQPLQVEPWYSPAFNDSSWARAVGQVGFGDGDEATVINAASDPTAVSGQFRGTFNVTDAGAIQQLVLGLVRDDGAVVYINGHEVFRDNMPAGEIDLATKATVAVWGADESTPIAVPIDPAFLTNGVNNIAVSVHNDRAGGGDLSFEVRSLRAVMK